MYKPYTYIKVQIWHEWEYREPLEGITFQDVHHEKGRRELWWDLLYSHIDLCFMKSPKSAFRKARSSVKTRVTKIIDKPDCNFFHGEHLKILSIHLCTKCDVHHVLLLVKISVPSRSVLSVKAPNFTCTHILSVKSHTMHVFILFLITHSYCFVSLAFKYRSEVIEWIGWSHLDWVWIHSCLDDTSHQEEVSNVSMGLVTISRMYWNECTCICSVSRVYAEVK